MSGGEAEAREFDDIGLWGARKWPHRVTWDQSEKTHGCHDCIYHDGGDLSGEEVSEENQEFF